MLSSSHRNLNGDKRAEEIDHWRPLRNKNNLARDEIKRQCDQCFWVKHSSKWTVFLPRPCFNILAAGIFLLPKHCDCSGERCQQRLGVCVQHVCSSPGFCYCYLCRPWRHTPHHWYTTRCWHEPSTEAHTTLDCQITIIINTQPASFIKVRCCRTCLLDDLSVYLLLLDSITFSLFGCICTICVMHYSTLRLWFASGF